jgi:hypothetical protein
VEERERDPGDLSFTSTTSPAAALHDKAAGSSMLARVYLTLPKHCVSYLVNIMRLDLVALSDVFLEMTIARAPLHRPPGTSIGMECYFETYDITIQYVVSAPLQCLENGGRPYAPTT